MAASLDAATQEEATWPLRFSQIGGDSLCMFSSRVPHDLKPTAWARARAERGAVPLDLTVSNPTVCGFDYPHGLLDPLRDPAALRYRPDPKGIRSAREAVACEYAAHGVVVDPDRIVITASSSESYGFLFKLLCDPGDTVLVPAPSYPLFEHLAALEGLRVARFPLDPEGAWQPLPSRHPAAEDARAAIVVHPNNPTGSWVDPAAADRLTHPADRPPIPLVVDEVFLDFPLAPHEHAMSFAGRTSGLTFTLGGLSKSRGLPQLKLSWIAVSGPGAAVARALDALEFIGDSYLSVGTPVQDALPEILARAAPVREAILLRCRENLARARGIAQDVPAVALLIPGGGWSLVVRFPRVVTEEALVSELLDRHGVAVHPGYFFDFPTDGYLVVSLLPDAKTFATGFKITIDMIASRL
jgi:alanine-synthesizing transaminase